MIEKINWSIVACVVSFVTFLSTCSRTTTSDLKKQNKELVGKIDSLGNVLKSHEKSCDVILLEHIPDASGYSAAANMGSKENNERKSISESWKTNGINKIKEIK